MIDSTYLREKATEYKELCQTKQIQPTFKGLGRVLGITGHTIANVYHGTINGIPYNSKERCNRHICNNDFDLIRDIFKENTV